MTQDNINLLTLRQYYLVMSSHTQKPFLDSGNGCYMFEVKSDADIFVKRVAYVFLAEPKYYVQKNFCTEFYSYGIETIHAKTRKNDDYIDIPVEKEDAKKQYYNPAASRAVYQLKQTRQTKYLRMMKDLSFFVPVLIDLRLPKQYPVMHYSYATFNGADKNYLLFTTIQEFDDWNKEQGEKWKPMEVNLTTFGRIRVGNFVMINPMSDKLLLTDKQIRISTGEKG